MSKLRTQTKIRNRRSHSIVSFWFDHGFDNKKLQFLTFCERKPYTDILRSQFQTNYNLQLN